LLTENQKFCSVLSVGNGRDTPRTRVSSSRNVQWKFSESCCSSFTTICVIHCPNSHLLKTI